MRISPAWCFPGKMVPSTRSPHTHSKSDSNLLPFSDETLTRFLSSGANGSRGVALCWVWNGDKLWQMKVTFTFLPVHWHFPCRAVLIPMFWRERELARVTQSAQEDARLIRTQNAARSGKASAGGLYLHSVSRPPRKVAQTDPTDCAWGDGGFSCRRLHKREQTDLMVLCVFHLFYCKTTLQLVCFLFVNDQMLIRVFLQVTWIWFTSVLDRDKDKN